MKLLYSYAFVIFTVIFVISCQQESKEVNTIFREASNVMEEFPDSALLRLDAIQNPDELSESQLAKYTLLTVQAKHKAAREIASDTLIFQSKDYYKKKKDTENLALSLYYSGQVLQAQNKYEPAIEMYLEARELVPQTAPSRLSILIDFAIGILYYKQYLCKDARGYFEQAKLKARTANDKYKDRINIETYLGNTYLLQHAYDSALVYYKKALDIAKEYNDIDEQIMLNQVSTVAWLHTENRNHSKQTIREALTLTSQIVHNSKLSGVYVNLAGIYLDKNQTDSTLYHSDIPKDLSQDYALKAILYETMSELEESKGNYLTSLKYLRKYTSCIDSVYTKKKNHNVLEAEHKYNIERIQNANRKLTIEKLWITIALGATTLTVLLIVFFISRKRAKDKEALLLAKQRIYQLKEMVAKQGEKEDTKHEINQKLRAALIEQMDIIKKVSLLEGLLSDSGKSKLSGTAVLQKVNKIIYKSTEEMDWSILFQTVNAIHDDFLIRLARTYPTLTEEEILICCLTKIGLSNEEIKLLVKYTTNVIQKKKSSIREKTNMKKQEHFAKQLDTLLDKE